MSEIDALELNLNTGGLMVMNASLFFIMFGVALELTIQDFKDLAKNPKSTLGDFFPSLSFCRQLHIYSFWSLNRIHHLLLV